MSQILQNFVKFQKFQLENLVDFEKCCKTHIFLQKSEPIQPQTSNILPKFCQPTLSGSPRARGRAALPRELHRKRRGTNIDVHQVRRALAQLRRCGDQRYPKSFRKVRASNLKREATQHEIPVQRFHSFCCCVKSIVKLLR